jgi:hypothetical protein
MLITLFYLLDKKLDEMTMKKFEKIRDNILKLHGKNSKRVEKEETNSPGPAEYFPVYNLVEDTGYAVKTIFENFF